MKFTKPWHRNSLLGTGCWVLRGDAWSEPSVAGGGIPEGFESSGNLVIWYKHRAGAKAPN